jgi:hypothetical protein
MFYELVNEIKARFDLVNSELNDNELKSTLASQVTMLKRVYRSIFSILAYIGALWFTLN